MRAATTFFVALALVPTLTTAATNRARYLMGTVCEVAVADGAEADIDAAFAEAQRVEAMLSTWRDDSELARVNAHQAQPSPELHDLLATTLHWAHETDGAFNPLVGQLVKVWHLRESVGAAGASPAE
ncbi:MAG TPA: FAD:protein FMN transferase, partial [Thermoanaerobaculia bacterium]|nr:FAD:protein FMN transferase [Thermoanaerobaculia bacterium]